jgi:ATP/ADP translocase
MMALAAAPFFCNLLARGVDSQEKLIFAVYLGLAQNILSKVLMVYCLSQLTDTDHLHYKIGIDTVPVIVVTSWILLSHQATKYAIFDPTKEMSYIPLDKDSKSTGKAAIDVLGARLGKSAGAFSQQLLVLIFGSITSGVPVVTVLFYAVIAMWIGKPATHA